MTNSITCNSVSNTDNKENQIVIYENERLSIPLNNMELNLEPYNKKRCIFNKFKVRQIYYSHFFLHFAYM